MDATKADIFFLGSIDAGKIPLPKPWVFCLSFEFSHPWFFFERSKKKGWLKQHSSRDHKVHSCTASGSTEKQKHFVVSCIICRAPRILSRTTDANLDSDLKKNTHSILMLVAWKNYRNGIDLVTRPGPARGPWWPGEESWVLPTHLAGPQCPGGDGIQSGDLGAICDGTRQTRPEGVRLDPAQDPWRVGVKLQIKRY